MERTGCQDAGNERRRYKLWLSGKGDGVSGVGIMVQNGSKLKKNLLCVGRKVEAIAG